MFCGVDKKPGIPNLQPPTLKRGMSIVSSCKLDAEEDQMTTGKRGRG